MDTGAPSLKHQRHKEEEIKSDLHHVRGQVEPAEPVRKFRKGACENCGSMSHKAKDCLERPRKVGAKFTGKDIRPDDFVKTAELNFDGKRDRWAGYDAEEYAAVVETFEKVEEERRKLKEAEMEVALQAKLANGENDSDSLSSSDSESSSSEDEKYAEKVDMPGQKVDTKSRMTVRNLRMREDTAKYLRNLDPESAYYDPKTRSMRDNPHPEAADPSMLPFAGDNFVRQSGEALEIPKLQVFAWQASERGIDISLQANPSYAEKMHKEHLRQKSEEAKRREQLLLEAYGSSADTSASSTKRDLVIPDEDDVYVEYSKDGNRITKVRKTA
jgi:pre-mRNA-processing factor SLU7